ncbi:MAG TPA: ABC transporter substrate-binding protein [Stellaceae bacterium]|nr:ABC transporter substrate-binding protein [Stellaceae bacterium]
MRPWHMALLLGAAACLAQPAASADKIKIGIISTFSGPSGFNGTSTRDAMNLALAHLGGTIGGLPAELLFEDDQQKPDQGVAIANKYLRSDKVDMIVGATFSNITIAMYVPIVKAETVIISSIAGPSQIAGKGCSPYFFSTSWQGDNFAEAMGAYLEKKGTQNIYLMAPNYAAGHDVLTGFKRYYKGKIADEVYTPLDQLDFTAEMTQIRSVNPAAMFVFYPGGLGIQFVKQYAQSGLKEKIPLFTAYTVDNSTLPAIGEDALGQITATLWNAELDNPANKRFVADFTSKYGYLPAEYGAQAYDTINLIDSAVRAVKGKIEDKKALIAALEKAEFPSVRGSFRFNTNHFAIQNFYMEEVVKGPNGKPMLKLGDVALKDHGDAYAGDCHMP